MCYPICSQLSCVCVCVIDESLGKLMGAHSPQRIMRVFNCDGNVMSHDGEIKARAQNAVIEINREVSLTCGFPTSSVRN